MPWPQPEPEPEPEPAATATATATDDPGTDGHQDGDRGDDTVDLGREQGIEESALEPEPGWESAPVDQRPAAVIADRSGSVPAPGPSWDGGWSQASPGGEQRGPVVAAASRRFRVGTPLPRPAAARAAVAPTGFADLATAAMAVASAAPGPSAAPDTVAGPPPAEGEETAVRSFAGPVPADLGLPTDTGARPGARPAPSQAGADEDDDLERPAAPSVDELYEQVRRRLRHELLVDRERAAMLAD